MTYPLSTLAHQPRPVRIIPMETPQPVTSPTRPSLKRSSTSVLSKFSRKPSARAPQRASSWDSNWQPHSGHPRRVEFSPDPHPRSARREIEVVESGGSALSEAQDAFTNSKRAVWTHILWTTPLEHDPRMIAQKDAVEALSLLAVSALPGPNPRLGDPCTASDNK